MGTLGCAGEKQVLVGGEAQVRLEGQPDPRGGRFCPEWERTWNSSHRQWQAIKKLLSVELI